MFTEQARAAHGWGKHKQAAPEPAGCALGRLQSPTLRRTIDARRSKVRNLESARLALSSDAPDAIILRMKST
jgi:hypothetical protein